MLQEANTNPLETTKNIEHLNKGIILNVEIEELKMLSEYGQK